MDYILRRKSGQEAALTDDCERCADRQRDDRLNCGDTQRRRKLLLVDIEMSRAVCIDTFQLQLIAAFKPPLPRQSGPNCWSGFWSGFWCRVVPFSTLFVHVRHVMIAVR